MTADFEKAVAYVLENEGGYSNIPEDSGGPTNWGITQADLAEWRGHPVSAEDVREMPIDEAKSIYFKRYWKAMRCDQMTQTAVATCIFDNGVLYGPGTSDLYAQRALVACSLDVAVDGVIGPQTLAALNVVEPKGFVLAFYNEIVSRINGIIEANPQDEMFRAGWMNRANRLLTLS